MRIISWNVNGLRAVERKGNLSEFLSSFSPDIFLLQEIRSQAKQVLEIREKYLDYEQFYYSAKKPGYAGTAIWVKKNLNVKVGKFFTGFPADFEIIDREGRISRLDIQINQKKFAIFSVYFPNGGKSPEAWEYKLKFYAKFLKYINILRQEEIECIWAGDVNCAHREIDLARPQSNQGKIGFHPLERQCIDKFIEDGWRDIFRDKFPDKKEVYSWWHVISRARERNVGWRIDYFFADKNFAKKIQNIAYLSSQMGSDHCPVMMKF